MNKRRDELEKQGKTQAEIEKILDISDEIRKKVFSTLNKYLK